MVGVFWPHQQHKALRATEGVCIEVTRKGKQVQLATVDPYGSQLQE